MGKSRPKFVHRERRMLQIFFAALNRKTNLAAGTSAKRPFVSVDLRRSATCTCTHTHARDTLKTRTGGFLLLAIFNELFPKLQSI